MDFKDKVVLVTGGSSGIGAATAIMFCKAGANVAIVGRNEAKLKGVAKACANAGASPLVIRADVAVDAEARRALAQTLQEFGKLHVLVNNAGVVRYGSLLRGDALQAYDEIMRVNLRAVVHLSMLAAPHLQATRGCIVNISSVAGQMQFLPAFVPYCTSKAGLDHFTRGCALELAASGVRVNAISPGPVETDIFENSGSTPEAEGADFKTPLGRVSQPDEIADLVLFLASDKARGITGSNFVSDNGVLIRK